MPQWDTTKRRRHRQAQDAGAEEHLILIQGQQVHGASSVVLRQRAHKLLGKHPGRSDRAGFEQRWRRRQEEIRTQDQIVMIQY